MDGERRWRCQCADSGALEEEVRDERLGKCGLEVVKELGLYVHLSMISATDPTVLPTG